MNRANIRTLDFGLVPIRKTHKIGRFLAFIELADEGYAEIRADYDTDQPFAVLLDEELNEI